MIDIYTLLAMRHNPFVLLYERGGTCKKAKLATKCVSVEREEGLLSYRCDRSQNRSCDALSSCYSIHDVQDVLRVVRNAL